MILRRGMAALIAGAAAVSGATAQDLVVGATPGEDVIAVPAGAIEAAIAELPRIVTEIMERSGVPGMSVGVVHEGALVFAEAFGVRDMASGAPVTTDTVFQIASISKPVSATVTAVAVGQGVAGWDDPVVSHLPDFRLSDAAVTAQASIGDFFAHRSGLPHAAGDELEDLGFDQAEILARLQLLALDPFRISYNYANFGTTTAAEAVAAAAGVPWADLAEATLFQPLGMSQTSYRHADFAARENAATLHGLEDGRFIARYTRDADAQAPAGGVSSNVPDMARWMGLLLGGGTRDGVTLFAPEDILPALHPQITSAPGGTLASRSGAYGYGFNVGVGAGGRVGWGHSGAFVMGAATVVQMLPSLDLGIVILSNGGPVGAVEAIVATFTDLTQFGEVSRDWYAGYSALFAPYYAPVGDLAGTEPPADAAPPQPLEAYAGLWQNPYFGPAEVVAGPDGLVVRLGPDGQANAVSPWDGDIFALAPSGENAPAGSLSSVRFSGTGEPGATMRIDYLDEFGQGTWRR